MTLGWAPVRAENEVLTYRKWVRRYRPRALETVAVSGSVVAMTVVLEE